MTWDSQTFSVTGQITATTAATPGGITPVMTGGRKTVNIGAGTDMSR